MAPFGVLCFAGMLSSATTALAFDVGVRLDLPVGSYPQTVAIGDVSGDGNLDLVVANTNDNTVSVLLSNGAGRFGAKTDFATGSTPQSVAIGDVNGDGKPDLAVANYDDATVSVLLGDGVGGFGAKTDFATGNYPYSLTIGDVSGDGKLDLVTSDYFDNTVSVLLGNGVGGFAAKTDFATGQNPTSIALGDVSGDGIIDLEVVNFASNTVSVLLGTGGGAFAAKRDLATGSTPFDVAFADMNGDGIPDLAVANYDDNTVSLLIGNGTGGFGSKADFAAGSNPQSLAVGDVSGDGIADVVVANQGSGTVSVLLGDGTGGLGAPVEFATGASGFGATSVAIGDLDGDGARDLAVVNQDDQTVTVLMSVHACGLLAKTDFATGTAPWAITTGDVNRDGRSDLAVGNQGAQTVSVLLGDGAGGFAAKTDYPAGGTPLSVQISDVSGDGNPDLVVACYGSNVVSVRLGNGAGVFGLPSTFPTGAGPYSVGIADVNGDGKLDLVIANADANTVSVLLGTGAGVFGAKVDYATGQTPESVVIGDLNGDLKPDLAVSNFNSGTVSIFLGDGVGGFGTKTDFLAGFRPYALANGDLNGDGVLDLAVANAGGNSVSVLLGTGTGGFAPKTEYAVGASPRSVAIGDVCSDGKLDLVVSSNGSNSVSVFPGNGTGIFGTRMDFATGSAPYGVALRDLNLDGQLDLAVVNLASNSVSVFLGLLKTRTSLAVLPHSAALGVTPVNLTATVSVVSPAGPDLPGGSVRFFDGTTVLGTAPLSGGVAVLTPFTASRLGAHSLTAVYLGDTKFLGSISPTGAMRVVPPGGNIAFTLVDMGLPGATETGSTWADFTGDGFLDIVLTAQETRLYHNNGDGTFSFHPSGTSVNGTLPGGAEPAVAWGDFNNDESLDFVLAGNGSNLMDIYRNGGTGTFSRTNAGLPSTDEGSVAWGDYDNDGFQDLAMSGAADGLHPTTRLYHNNQNGTFTLVPAGFAPIFEGALAWGDYDRDGDLDLLMCGTPCASIGCVGQSSITRLYRNDGDGTFTELDPGFKGVCEASLRWGDYDNDGWPDVLLTGFNLGGTTEAGQWSLVYRNNGNGTFTDIAAGLMSLGAGSAAWGDCDNDGDLDILLTGSGNNRYHTLVYRNDGNGAFTKMDIGLTGVEEGNAAWGDYDNDGDLDILVTGYLYDQGGATTLVYRNDAAIPNTRPFMPAGLTSSISGNLATFSWSPSTDGETPSPGLSYNLRIGTSPGGSQIVSSMANLGSGFRRVVQLGNVQQRTSWTMNLPASWSALYWSVQAVDAAYAGSLFAPEQHFAPVSVEGGLPTELSFAIEGANPVMQGASFRLGLPTGSSVDLSIYDVRGRRVAKLLQGSLEAGYHTVGWDRSSSRPGPGVYFAVLRAGRRELTKKLTLLHSE